jgi:hypothetical protein
MVNSEYYNNFIGLEFERIQEIFRFRKLQEFFESTSRQFMNILEIGPGLNSVAKLISNNQKITILEPGIELYNQNKTNFLKLENRKNIDLLNINLDDYLTLNDKTGLNGNFDCVILSSVIHEIENFNFLFRKMKANTANKCVFFIVVNNKNSIHRLIGRELKIIATLDEITSTEIMMGQSKAVSVQEIKNYLSDYGIEITRVETFFPKLLNHLKMYKLFENKQVDMEFLERLYAISSELPEFGSEIIIEAQSQ